MILLGLVEPMERHDLRDDRCVEHLRRVQLRDIRIGDAPLLLVRVEDRGAVLLANVGALAIFRRRIVRDREEDLEQLTVADALRIEPDFHRLGMFGPS